MAKRGEEREIDHHRDRIFNDEIKYAMEHVYLKLKHDIHKTGKPWARDAMKIIKVTAGGYGEKNASAISFRDLICSRSSSRSDCHENICRRIDETF